jgi:hypothetical protein
VEATAAVAVAVVVVVVVTATTAVRERERKDSKKNTHTHKKNIQVVRCSVERCARRSCVQFTAKLTKGGRERNSSL